MYKYKQRTVSKWDKSLASTHRNTTAFQKKLPYGWIKARKICFLRNIQFNNKIKFRGLQTA
jgi:hypothetical protein